MNSAQGFSPRELRALHAAHESECGVLGSCIVWPQHIDAIGLSVEHFADPTLAKLWAVLVELHELGEGIDPVRLNSRYTERHGPLAPTRAEQFAFLGELAEYVLSGVDHTAFYAANVRRQHAYRLATSIGRRLANDGDADAAMRAIQAAQLDLRDRWVHAGDALHDAMLRIGNEPPRIGIATGFDGLDNLGGLYRGELAVLIARPGHGKTAFAINVLTSANTPAVMFSGEQDVSSVLQRIAASVGGVPLQRLRVNGLEPSDLETISNVAAWLAESRLTIVDRPAPALDDIRRETRKAIAAHGAQLVVVDYLQRMRSPTEAKWEAVGENIAGLKEIAREFDVAVLCLAQARRDCDERVADERCPRLTDCQHSSAIEQEADVVLGLYRERAYEPMSPDRSALLRVLKNRQGTRGDIRLEYAGQFVRFENVPARRVR